MKRSNMVKRFIVLAIVAAAGLVWIPSATAASKSVYFKNCDSSGWDVDVWLIDMDNGADGYDKFLSPGKSVTLTCQDDDKCSVEAAIGLDFYDLDYVKQSDSGSAKYYIRTVKKFLHVDFHWDKTGSVCSNSY